MPGSTIGSDIERECLAFVEIAVRSGQRRFGITLLTLTLRLLSLRKLQGLADFFDFHLILRWIVCTPTVRIVRIGPAGEAIAKVKCRPPS